MGWTYVKLSRHETPVEYITRTFSYERNGAKAAVLAAAAVRGTIYAAIRQQDRPTAKPYVYCAVVLFKNNRRDGFGYKDMSESMGPYYWDCPDRIMRLLSPVSDIPHPGHTAEWRANVAAVKEQRRAARVALSTRQPRIVQAD